VAAQPVVAAPPAYSDRRVDRVESSSMVAPHAIVGGLFAVAMLVWGGVAMARAGFDGEIKTPVVDVLGIQGNALSGAIVAGVGLIMLLVAISQDRGSVIFMSIVLGVASLIAAIEPSVGNDALGIDSTLPVLLAIGSAVTLLVALLAPTVIRRSRTVEHA
jgi:hypothetical protein